MTAFTDCPDTFYLNFVLYENDSFYKEFNWRENPNGIRVTPANEASFELIDTTGLTALMQIKPKTDWSVSPIVQLTETDGISFPGKVSPNIIIQISDVKLATLGVGLFSYDMIVTDGTSRDFTLFAGDLTIKQNVSQPV